MTLLWEICPKISDKQKVKYKFDKKFNEMLSVKLGKESRNSDRNSKFYLPHTHFIETLTKISEIN